MKAKEFLTDRRTLWGWVVAMAFVAGVLVTSSSGYERYNDGCSNANCHGAFTDGTSPAGTFFPNNDKHRMHRNNGNMATECDLCHSTGDGNDPFIGSSDGTATNPGAGCTGCHGRDYGGTIGNSGVGLRAHHANNGVMECGPCHPNDPAPLRESVVPVYYGTIDTLANDPCNRVPMEDVGENWSRFDDPLLGSDNDGDNLYDMDDPDCNCPQDLTGAAPGSGPDGTVNVFDLLLLLGDFGCPNPPAPPAPCIGDITGSNPGDPPDGVTNVFDLLSLLGQFGNNCPTQ